MKIVFSDKKTGKTAQADVPKEKESMLMGKRIGEVIDGFAANLEGFKLQITGLSDKGGAPSRKEIEGTRKVRVLLGGRHGLGKKSAGYRARKLVRGNTISADTEQVNTVIAEYGTKPMEELFKPKEKKEE